MTSRRRPLTFAAFYIGWMACVAGAAHGHFWLGPGVVAIALVLHLCMTATPMADARLIATTGVVGFGLEALFVFFGLYTFADTRSAQWLCPPWMVALWMIFATTLRDAQRLLAGRYALAALLGALAGAASYVAGARLGAITLHPNVSFSLAGLALAWAAVMPALLWLLGRRESPSPIAS